MSNYLDAAYSVQCSRMITVAIFSHRSDQYHTTVSFPLVQFPY
jgi:hypothetical protein